MSGSKTITGAEDRLDNVHPGEVLREDFLIGSDIPLTDVVTGTGIAAVRLGEILAGKQPVDAAVDLRLARYFGVSEGFFLGLQIDYDLEEERRKHGAEIDRIARRAA
ncbi:HigA family addiction module antitoxin [Novosphingobium cyanobacteriorum]|uniref:HigA family addiction module antitoxin n=1 Tax=Novosphingobium cyanobacteriorum TaxID=3024215 RepID=A0ABT6CJT3_9SPHN|nr:HigA family addiction module antitoxin [Novosphingobium cyanobacteriorum]MDF8334151.1 HigA family addiction module antitoxin [Novosphingobium cyanobacteriorum]